MTPEDWWAALRPYWRAYQRRAYHGFNCRVHVHPIAPPTPEAIDAWDAQALAHSDRMHKEQHEHDQE